MSDAKIVVIYFIVFGTIGKLAEVYLGA